ncbi:MFS transporter [Brachybacterium sp. JHP9]|uniref:MFS transporter n=1 Tax=Brachybacterium equifaecis TaxID=2910770 RepID=A0ABT0QZ33_9MICO|nr:MFS transporter [Brachybacterium equifaecis]
MTTPAISASPAYRWWLAATTADRYGGSVTTLALMLLAYAITGSTMLAGVIGTVRMLISFGLAPIGGLIVDSHDRRRLMLLRAGLSGAIWLLIAILVMFGSMPFALLLILVSLATAVGSLLGSAGEAALRSMTTPEQYASAMSINQARDSYAELIGNPLAGLLYAIGAAFPFFFTVLGFVVMGTATSFLPPLKPRVDPKDDGGEAREPRWRRALGGFRWIAQRRQMLVLTMMSASSNFGVFLVFVLIELYLIRSGMTAVLIGLMNTAEAVGVLLAAAV